jgi:hypothetical protein
MHIDIVLIPELSESATAHTHVTYVCTSSSSFSRNRPNTKHKMSSFSFPRHMNMMRVVFTVLFVAAACGVTAFPSCRTSLVPSSPRAFVPSSSIPSGRTISTCLSASSSTPQTTSITTFTDETIWNIRLLLQGLPTEKGKKVDEFFTFKARFVEEDGFEPPQGTLKVGGDEETRLKITKSRWLLSEDPNDKKDSLWIWGLFKEPLYPFLLLQLETDRIPLSGDEGDFVKPLKLYAQLIHKRKDGGVTLQGCDLKVREMETFNADPFGAAKVTVYEEVSVGKLSLDPL